MIKTEMKIYLTGKEKWNPFTKTSPENMILIQIRTLVKTTKSEIIFK